MDELGSLFCYRCNQQFVALGFLQDCGFGSKTEVACLRCLNLVCSVGCGELRHKYV